MPDFSFRIRFVRCGHTTLTTDLSRYELVTEEVPAPVILSSHKAGSTIEKSDNLILKASGWPSESEAQRAADYFLAALMRALAHVRVGVDFGRRGPSSFFTREGLRYVSEKTGRPALNDVQGTLIYDTTISPVFVRGDADMVRGVSFDSFQEAFSHALEHSRELTEQEKLSFELFNASFFQPGQDARFLLLMMAVEALIVNPARSAAATAHVDRLIELTAESEALTADEQSSLVGSLSRLKQESIKGAGRKFAAERLGSRTYGSPEANASDFFGHCYDLRSRLVHGSLPYPSWNQVSSAAAALEVFVSHLLT